MTSCEAGQGIALPDDDPPYLGTRGAPVTLAVFGDVKCPYTAKMWLALFDYVDELESRGQADAVEIQFRHYPVLRSKRLAWAAEAAHRQHGNDAFFEMYWCLVTAEGSDQQKTAFCAAWLGYDRDELEETRASDAVQNTVSNDDALARNIGFIGAPGLLLCGYWMPSDAERVIANIDALIAE